MCLVLYIPLLVRLVPMAGGSTHPLCTTARLRGRGSGTGQRGWRLPEPGSTAHTRAEPGGTARTIACRWGRQTVVMRRLVIDLFELKFDRLNMNSIV
jgi:hypothetical protein